MIEVSLPFCSSTLFLTKKYLNGKITNNTKFKLFKALGNRNKKGD